MSIITQRSCLADSVLLLFALVILSIPAYSQPSVNTDENQSVFEKMKDKDTPLPPIPEMDSNSSKEDQSFTLPEVWCTDIDDELTRSTCWEAYRASLDYYKIGFQHRKKVFWWQHFSSRIIFFVVLTLVAIGVYFAWIQFKFDLGAGESSSKTGAAKESSVELSSSGIKVSSPVLGVIILTLSLAFFYLYLVYVFPIAEIF